MAVTLKGALGQPVPGTQVPGSQSSDSTQKRGFGGALPQHIQITSMHTHTLIHTQGWRVMSPEALSQKAICLGS